MLQDQLIAVFVAVVAEPVIRWVKARFNLDGSKMLLVAVTIAAVGAAGIVGYGAWQSGEAFTFESLIALAPTVFAVGQIIFALL